MRLIGGTNEYVPNVVQPTGSNPRFKDGQVIAANCSVNSDYSGPFTLSRPSLDFGTDTSELELTIANATARKQQLTLRYLASVAATDTNRAPVQPDLYYWGRVGSNDWQWLEFPASMTLTNDIGGSSTLYLAISRTNLESGVVKAGLFSIQETRVLPSGTGTPSYQRVLMPLSVEGATYDEQNAARPAGLWVGSVELDRVTYYHDTHTEQTPTEDVAATPISFRVILHVDSNGTARLLQRAHIVQETTTNGTAFTRLYANAADPGTATEDRLIQRISSIAFPPDVAIPTSSGFGDATTGLTFSYTVPADSPSNPFRHAFHPDHDGKTFNSDNSVTDAPSGDDPQNYLSVVKPELFSLSNSITFLWPEPETAGPDFLSDSDNDYSRGACTWTLYNVRGTEKPITCKGSFSLQRLHPVGNITVE